MVGWWDRVGWIEAGRTNRIVSLANQAGGEGERERERESVQGHVQRRANCSGL
jgi:hypothetical protein